MAQAPSKRQKIDRELDLRLANPKIDAEAQILAKLRRHVFSSVRLRWKIEATRPLPTLYSKYRGKGFPLRDNHLRMLPRWRDLSPWMKLQVATLALAEGHFIQFTAHLHDDRREDLASKGADLRKYIMDRISRRLRGTFGDDRPGFLFVVEDRDKDGIQVRPHAHGSISVPMINVAMAPARRRSLEKLVAEGKKADAELLAGRMIVRNALKAAVGLNKRAPKVAASGRNQSRNVWTKVPTFVISTNLWVSYAFKNVNRFSQVLGEDRDAISTSLKADARDLWEVIRTGDKAIEKIASRSRTV